MQPIRSVKNQYQGVNAHLHSYWQNAGGWNSFHGNHIADLLRLLRVQLLPLGYTAEMEPSLQIRQLDQPAGEPESDITIFDRDPVRPFLAPEGFISNAGVLVVSAPAALQEASYSEKEFRAVVLYERTTNEVERGHPVAWLELLSPSNKGNSRDAELYRAKRSKIIHSGIVFVEIDYLHESGTTLSKVASYRVRRGQPAPPNANPYRIAVINPRPDFRQGKAYISGFNADDPIPTVAIPLNADDVLSFDFNAPYQKTFIETLYGLELVDYRQFPVHFDRYSPADQQRIANRMLAVLQAAASGLDLETGPFAAGTSPLAEVLAALERLTSRTQ